MSTMITNPGETWQVPPQTAAGSLEAPPAGSAPRRSFGDVVDDVAELFDPVSVVAIGTVLMLLFLLGSNWFERHGITF